MPAGVNWIQKRAEGVDPDRQLVTLDAGTDIGYEYLIVCRQPAQLRGSRGERRAGRSGRVNQLPARLCPHHVAQHPDTWGGTAVFTMSAGPIKCAGAPQKIAYLAADYWRQQGTLQDTRVFLVLPTPGMFGVKVFSDELEKVVARYGIEVHKNSRWSRSTAPVAPPSSATTRTSPR